MSFLTLARWSLTTTSVGLTHLQQSGGGSNFFPHILKTYVSLANRRQSAEIYDEHINSTVIFALDYHKMAIDNNVKTWAELHTIGT